MEIDGFQLASLRTCRKLICALRLGSRPFTQQILSEHRRQGRLLVVVSHDDGLSSLLLTVLLAHGDQQRLPTTT